MNRPIGRGAQAKPHVNSRRLLTPGKKSCVEGQTGARQTQGAVAGEAVSGISYLSCFVTSQALEKIMHFLKSLCGDPTPRRLPVSQAGSSPRGPSSSRAGVGQRA